MSARWHRWSWRKWRWWCMNYAFQCLYFQKFWSFIHYLLMLHESVLKRRNKRTVKIMFSQLNACQHVRWGQFFLFTVVPIMTERWQRKKYKKLHPSPSFVFFSLPHWAYSFILLHVCRTTKKERATHRWWEREENYCTITS